MREEIHDNIEKLLDEADNLIDQRYYEAAIPKLKYCLRFEDDSLIRGSIVFHLGYCYIMMGWYNEAVKIYTQHLKDFSEDNDIRFALASAYGSMSWTDESINELKKIIELDPTDVLAYHDLGLCYKDKGWIKESLETLNFAKENALIYGDDEEKELIEKTLANLEKEIGEGEKDKFRMIILLAMLLRVKKKKR